MAVTKNQNKCIELKDSPEIDLTIDRNENSSPRMHGTIIGNLSSNLNSSQESCVRYQEDKQRKHNLFAWSREIKEWSSKRCIFHQMNDLRLKFVNQALKYVGLSYKHLNQSDKHVPGLFLDYCGHIRMAIKDLKNDFQFEISEQNPASLYDMLPFILESEGDLLPGDLIFTSGIYHNKEIESLPHNIVHAEIWVGEGTHTIGIRKHHGFVDLHPHYIFEAETYHSAQYIFKSINVWLTGSYQRSCHHQQCNMVFNYLPMKSDLPSPDNSCVDNKHENMPCLIHIDHKFKNNREERNSKCHLPNILSPLPSSRSLFPNRILLNQGLPGPKQLNSEISHFNYLNNPDENVTFNRLPVSLKKGLISANIPEAPSPKQEFSTEVILNEDCTCSNICCEDNYAPGKYHCSGNIDMMFLSKSDLKAFSLPWKHNPKFYIKTGSNGYSLVMHPLLAMGWERINDKTSNDFILKWVECRKEINYSKFQEGMQIVNHIQNGAVLTNKLCLLTNLREYERISDRIFAIRPIIYLQMKNFIPETYCVYSEEEREYFHQKYQEGEIWISKPSNKNKGTGIFLIRNSDEVKTFIENNSKPFHQSVYPSALVQKYIQNPLLLNGRKADIRAYMLIASTNPFLVLFRLGYVRLSCHMYKESSEDLTTHLTNQYIQKKHPLYCYLKNDTVWSMNMLNDYINKHVVPEKGLENDWVFNKMQKQMEKITMHCFNSVKRKLLGKIGYFDLLGMDFMLDTNLQVWLLEINVNPALHVNCPVLKEVVPLVVEETLYIVLECFHKGRHKEPLRPITTRKYFKILYCQDGRKSTNLK